MKLIAQQIFESIQQATNIVITAHKSPDGDSIGSSIALFEICKSLNKNVVICHTDPSPSFLNWLPGTDKILNFEENSVVVEEQLATADLLFALDYNDASRLGNDMGALFSAAKGKKIMIDHHLNPADFVDISLSQPASCSTCELIFEMLDAIDQTAILSVNAGTAIYLGIMTDTGSFRFPSVTAYTHHVIGKLIQLGVKHYEIHENVFDTNTLDRLKLRGFATSEKIELINGGNVALIALTQAELDRFNYQKGDTEGLVNVALSIQGMKAAIMMTEADGYVKISFRSKGTENPVNVMANTHFHGGGHMNASGGRFDGSLTAAMELLKHVIGDFISK